MLNVLCDYSFIKITSMNSYENLYNSICRLCLKFESNKKMVSLIDKTCEEGISSYAKAVSNLTNVVTDKQDKLPSFMCLNCLYLLKQAIYFKLQCEYSNKCLKRISHGVYRNEDLKQAIVEFAMLNFYFDYKYSFKPKEKKAKTKSKSTKINSDKDENYKSVLFDVNRNTESLCDNTSLPCSDTELSTHDDELKKMEEMFGSNYDIPINIQTPRRRGLKHKRKDLHKRNLNSQSKLNKTNEKENFICNVCHKILANQHTYDHHMQRHNGCRYICEHCGKGFPVLAELQIHQVSRHGTGPYLQCAHCSFKAPRKFDLIEHERIHTGDRPYTCDKCGLTFRRRGIWKKHLIYHTEKRIQCPQCHRKFFLRSDMLAHANSVHDRAYVYLCSKCGATYAKTATVRRHMTERHGIPRDAQGKVIRINK